MSIVADALTQHLTVEGVPYQLPLGELTNFSQEMIGVLPLVIPVVLVVIAIRKGLRLLTGILRGA